MECGRHGPGAPDLGERTDDRKDSALGGPARRPRRLARPASRGVPPAWPVQTPQGCGRRRGASTHHLRQYGAAEALGERLWGRGRVPARPQVLAAAASLPARRLTERDGRRRQRCQAGLRVLPSCQRCVPALCSCPRDPPVFGIGPGLWPTGPLGFLTRLLSGQGSRLPGTAQLTNLLEEAGDGLGPVAVGTLVAASVTRPHAANGDCPPDMAAWDLGCTGWACALPQTAPGICRPRVLPPHDEAVMQLPRILEAIIVEEPGLGHGTEGEQMMPVAVVARQAGRRYGAAGPAPPGTHRRQPWAPAGALLPARAPAPHVVIEPDDLGKPQPAGLSRAGLLPPLTRGGGAGWMAGGVAAIHRGIPLERARGHLGAPGDTPRSGPGGGRR